MMAPAIRSGFLSAAGISRPNFLIRVPFSPKKCENPGTSGSGNFSLARSTLRHDTAQKSAPPGLSCGFSELRSSAPRNIRLDVAVIPLNGNTVKLSPTSSEESRETHIAAIMMHGQLNRDAREATSSAGNIPTSTLVREKKRERKREKESYPRCDNWHKTISLAKRFAFHDGGGKLRPRDFNSNFDGIETARRRQKYNSVFLSVPTNSHYAFIMRRRGGNELNRYRMISQIVAVAEINARVQLIRDVMSSAH